MSAAKSDSLERLVRIPNRKEKRMKVELNPWIVPNFVTAKMPPRPRQEGFGEGPKWSLAEVDTATLAAQCDQFRAEVFRKAGKSDPANTAPEQHEVTR
jgi:hypothetical protein